MRGVYLALKHFLNFRFFVCRGRKGYAEKIRALPVHRDITGRLGLLKLSPQGAAVQQPVTAKQSAVAGEHPR